MNYFLNRTVKPSTRRRLLNYFVYGTLKKGYHNHRILEAQAESVVPATVTGYSLYSYSARGIPYAVKVEDGLVSGELITLRDDARADEVAENLDRLEGHPQHYVRTLVGVRRASDGLLFLAWIYVRAAGSFEPKDPLREIGPEWPASEEVWNRTRKESSD